MRSLEHVEYVESAQVYKTQDCKTQYGAPWVRYTANLIHLHFQICMNTPNVYLTIFVLFNLSPTCKLFYFVDVGIAKLN